MKHPSKMNILMIIPWMEMGGADLFNLHIVEKINKEKFAVSIVCTQPAKNCWKHHFEKWTENIWILPEFLKPEEYAAYIIDLVGQKNIDLIFLSNSYYGYHLLPMLKCTYPQIAVVDYVHMEEWYWRTGGYARLSGMLECCLDQTLVCNQQTRNVLIDHFGRTSETVRTLYIGVDQNRFDNTRVPHGQIRAKYNIPDDKKVILFPCRIHPQKRPFLMLEIAKHVISRDENVCFFVAGDGPLLPELKDKISQMKLNNWFVCTGEISEMEKVYADSDLTLICSLKEGLSLTAYESCAMATPVVSADVGGQKELIDDTMGRLIPLHQKEEDLDSRVYSIEEIDAYTNAIFDVFADKTRYDQMCCNCREKIERQFSCDQMIVQLEEIFRNTMGKVQSNQEQKQFPDYLMGWAKHYLETYLAYENAVNPNGNGEDLNLELKRIANSRLGKLAIKILMKLKINKLFC